MKVDITSQRPKYDYQFKVADIGLVGVYGISGSGKSSLLNAIAGYLDNNHRIINFNNKQLQGVIKCSYMDQHPILFPHWTIIENLNFAIKYSNASLQILDDLVLQLECKDLLNKFPEQLSGGEKQRVAYIRALLLIEENSIVLLDEPFSALDIKLRKTALNLLRNYKQISLIFLVTHKISELYEIADELLYIKDGRIDYQDTIVNAMSCSHQDLPLASKITLDTVKIKGKHIIYADDVSISLQKHPDSSIVHQIATTIQQITFVDDFVLLELSINDNKELLYAKITKNSLNHLKLKEIQQVIANFKATSFR